MPALFPYLHTYTLRFALQHQPGFDVFAFIARAAADGFAGVCLSANDPSYRHLGGREPARLARIRGCLQEHAMLCDMDTSGTGPAHLRAMLAVAQAIGARQLRTYTRYQGPPSSLIERTVADLRAVAPAAAALGITVLLENHETFTGKEIARILALVDSPWVAALFDYGNSQMVLEDPLDALAAMAPFARSAHLKDHLLLRPEQSPDGRLSVLGVPLEEGHLPLQRLTARLLAAGCQRIALENSWGYRAPLKRERMTPQGLALLGRGSFTFAEPPLPNERTLLDPGAFSPAQLVKMEEGAYRRGVAWLQQWRAKPGPS